MAESHVTTIRLSKDFADALDLIARVEGVTEAALIREAVQTLVESRIAQAAFKQRLSDRIAADKVILSRLGSDAKDVTS